MTTTEALSQTDRQSFSLAAIAQRAQNLYSLPAVAMEVLDLTADPQVDAQLLKTCIERDPALTVKLLRVVNSSLFGLPRRVSDLGQALTLLGTKPLKMLVLGFSLPKELFGESDPDVVRFYWRYSLTKAVAAREIAKTVFHSCGDEAFITGLLHDIGLLVLLQDIGRPYAEFVKKIVAEKREFASPEKETLGYDHTALTIKLLTHWQLPVKIVSTMAALRGGHQNAFSDKTEPALCNAIALGGLMADLLVVQRLEAMLEINALIRQSIDPTPETINTLIENIAEAVEELADVLAVEIPKEAHYYQILGRAHEQLSRLTSGMADGLLDSACPVPEAWPETRQLRARLREPAKTAWAAERQAYEGNTPACKGKTSRATGPNRPEAIAPAGLFDENFSMALNRRLAENRENQCPISLMVIQLDRFSDLLIHRGTEGTEHILRAMQTVVRRTCEGVAEIVRTGDSQLAVILENRDRQQAVADAREIIEAVGHWGIDPAGKERVSVSIGVASLTQPPKNYPPQDLIEAAQRCMLGVFSGKGNGIKSIAAG